jgi:hypothetical protein
VLGVLQFAAGMDLDGVPHCPACLLELAWEIRDGRRPSRALISRTTDWIWSESGDGIREAAVRARMAEVPFAEEALRDLELNGRHSKVAETLVFRLAQELADEMASR